MMVSSAYAYDWILIGLSFDLWGGLALAKGFVRKTVSEAYLEAQPRSNVNSFAVKSAIVQKAEAVVGAFLLSLGFVLQMCGNFRGAPAANDLGWIDSLPRLALLMVGTGAACALSLRLAHLWARRRFWIYFARNFRVDAAMLLQTGRELDALGILFYLERKRQEPDDAYRSRLESRRFQVGVKYGGREREMR